MRRIAFFLLALSTWFGAEAYTVRNHATVAYIAQQHLSSRARAKVCEIFHGQNLVDYASWPDFYRLTMLYANKKQVAHLVMVGHDFKPVDTLPNKSAYNAIKYSADLLKNHYNELSDSARITNLSIIVHLLGDIHCPSHYRFADRRDKKIKKLRYQTYPGKGKIQHIKYHSFWDAFSTDMIFCGGFLDVASMLDTYSKKQIRQIQDGTLEDWIYDNAVYMKDVFDVENDELVDRSYVVDKAQVAKTMIRNGGYRLAKLLNCLFN